MVISTSRTITMLLDNLIEHTARRVSCRAATLVVNGRGRYLYIRMYRSNRGLTLTLMSRGIVPIARLIKRTSTSRYSRFLGAQSIVKAHAAQLPVKRHAPYSLGEPRITNAPFEPWRRGQTRRIASRSPPGFANADALLYFRCEIQTRNIARHPGPQ